MFGCRLLIKLTFYTVSEKQLSKCFLLAKSARKWTELETHLNSTYSIRVYWIFTNGINICSPSYYLLWFSVLFVYYWLINAQCGHWAFYPHKNVQYTMFTYNSNIYNTMKTFYINVLHLKLYKISSYKCILADTLHFAKCQVVDILPFL